MNTRFENRRARLLEYAPWIMRDYLTNQGPSTALVVFLVGYLSVLPILSGITGQVVKLGEVPLELAKNSLYSNMPPLVFLGTFFATNGIIANDRKTGYYRFLFAKPVSPLTYYATTFALYGIGLLAVSAVLLLIWSMAVRPMFPAAFFLIVPLMYVAYGGLGFLLSALWRFDWLSLVTVLAVSNVAWSLWENTRGLKHWLLYVLPPVQRAADVYALVLGPSRAFPWLSVAWLVGYGLICFLLGLVVIRRRPLGAS